MNRYLLLGSIALSFMVGTASGQLIPPSQSVLGQSQSALADQWYPWILEAPASTNPLFDMTGAWAGVNNDGPVFFLAGSTGGFVTRTITVPSGKALFFPIGNTSDIELPLSMDPKSCLGAADPDACALAFITPPLEYSEFVASLDGALLATDLAPFFQRSSALSSFCPSSDDNLFGIVPPDCGGVVQMGYYMALEPLSPGAHVLKFGLTALDGTQYGAIDTLNVVPEAPTWTMMVVGFAGLGYAAWSARRRTQVALE